MNPRNFWWRRASADLICASSRPSSASSTRSVTSLKLSNTLAACSRATSLVLHDLAFGIRDSGLIGEPGQDDEDDRWTDDRGDQEEAEQFRCAQAPQHPVNVS